MKIMNQIEAEHSGTVLEILVKDGEAVEFGQPLIIVQ
jgi:biotin carboxyl carrier protein